MFGSGVRLGKIGFVAFIQYEEKLYIKVTPAVPNYRFRLVVLRHYKRYHRVKLNMQKLEWQDIKSTEKDTISYLPGQTPG